MNLFVYGTLMDEALVIDLTHQRFKRLRATLIGYRRHAPDGDYPYIVEDADARVDGFLLLDVDAEALSLFDRYEDEGHLYHRTAVTVSVGSEQQPAWVYVRRARR